MAKVIAVSNNKGGTAKTTTAATISVGLARAGKRVLAVDNDPQGHLSMCLGVEYPGDLASVARRFGHASMTTTQKTYLHIIQEL